jgi:O-antigen ligase
MKIPINASLKRAMALGLIAYMTFVLPIGLANGEAAQESSLQKNIKAIGLIMCLAVSALHAGTLLKISGRIGPAMHLALVAVIGLSALYAPNPTYVVYSAAAYLGLWGICNYLAERGDGERMLSVMMWSLVAFVGCSWLMLAISHERAGTMAWTPTGGAWRFVGLCGRPVNMAVIAAIMTGLAFLDRGQLRRVGKVAIIVLGVTTVVLTKSRTPLLVVMAAVGAIFLLKRTAKFGLVSVIALVGMSIAIGMLDGTDLAGKYLTRSGRTEELTTLTSRTEVWAYVIGEWKKEPIFGFGYGSTKELLLNKFYLWDFTTESAHNLLLQCLFTLGLVGAAILTLIFVVQARQVLFSNNRSAIFLIAFVYFMGITEASFIGPGVGMMTLCWMAGGALLQKESSRPRDFSDTSEHFSSAYAAKSRVGAT